MHECRAVHACRAAWSGMHEGPRDGVRTSCMSQVMNHEVGGERRYISAPYGDHGAVHGGGESSRVVSV